MIVRLCLSFLELIDLMNYILISAVSSVCCRLCGVVYIGRDIRFIGRLVLSSIIRIGLTQDKLCYHPIVNAPTFSIRKSAGDM